MIVNCQARLRITSYNVCYTKLLRLLSGRDPVELIRANHRLLTRIGVVPAALIRFAEQIEQLGGAAKVCGAGAVSGDAGGLIV